MCEIIATFHHFINAKTTIIEHETHSKIEKVLNEENADHENTCSALSRKLHKNELLMNRMENFLNEGIETMCVDKHSAHLSCVKTLFEKVVKIMNGMNAFLNFYVLVNSKKIILFKCLRVKNLQRE